MHYVSTTEMHKQPQSTFQAKNFIESSLTTSVALLVPLSGIVYPMVMVNCHQFARSQNESRPGYARCSYNYHGALIFLHKSSSNIIIAISKNVTFLSAHVKVITRHKYQYNYNLQTYSISHDLHKLGPRRKRPLYSKFSCAVIGVLG